MEERKEPCETCGDNWKPTSRREFLQSAFVVGIGLSFATAGLTAATEARAAGFDIHECLIAAGNAFEACRTNAIVHNPGNSVKARAKRFAAIAACQTAFDATTAACYAQLAAEVAAELAQFVLEHPIVLFPTIIVVAGMAIVVLAGGVAVFL